MLTGVVLPVDGALVDREHALLHEARDVVLAKDGVDERLTRQHASVAPAGDAAHAEVAGGALVREPDQLRLVAYALPQQVLVDVGDVLERRALACRAGMPGADDELAGLALLHAGDVLQVRVATLHGVSRGADRVRVAGVRPQTRRRREVEARAGCDDQMVVVDADPVRGALVALLGDHEALVRVDFDCLARQEMDVHPIVHRAQREARLIRPHVPDAHPHQRGNVQEPLGRIDHGDVVLPAKRAAQVEGRRVAGKSGADDDYPRHGSLPKGRVRCAGLSPESTP